MIKDIKKLIVKYNDVVVGYLIDFNHKIAFEYDEEWLKVGFSISPFSLPLKSGIFINKKDTFDGLYGVFNDSLPDGWGELLWQRMLFKRGIDLYKLSPLTKLSLINKDGLGALTYEPSQVENDRDVLLELDIIAKEVDNILNNKSNDKNLDSIYKLGGSSGGARPKVHLKYNDDDWIIKFPCSYDPKDIGVREYKANLLAKECGLNINECKLFDSKICHGYFGSKRFDRHNKKRVHMISLSSLLETSHRISNLDYLHLFQVIWHTCVDKDDMYEAFGRMCFNVLYENKDDHGKNFAFLYDENKKGYVLSPFYDITKSLDKYEHEMTINGVGNPNEEDLLKIIEIMNLSKNKCIDIIKRIKDVLKYNQ